VQAFFMRKNKFSKKMSPFRHLKRIYSEKVIREYLYDSKGVHK